MTDVAVDPRIERTRAVVLEATLDELAEVGYGPLTIEAIARRAGVSKATIYRHWAGKLDLVADAVARLKQMPQPPDVDDHRARIAGLLRSLAEHVGTSRAAACIPALIEASLRDAAVREFHVRTSAERLAFITSLLDDAVADGALAQHADTRRLAELLVSPIFFRKLMAPEPFPTDEVDALVDEVLGPYWAPATARR